MLSKTTAMDWVIRTLDAPQTIYARQGEWIDLLHGDFDWEELFGDEENDVVAGSVTTRPMTAAASNEKPG